MASRVNTVEGTIVLLESTSGVGPAFEWDPAEPLFGSLVLDDQRQRVYTAGAVDTTASVDHSDEYVGHEHEDDGLRIVFRSSNWAVKVLHVTVVGDRLRFAIHVEGPGAITSTHFFSGLAGGPADANPRILHLNDKRAPARSEFEILGAEPVWTSVWSPEITASGRWTSGPDEPVHISCSGDLDYRGGNFQSSPAPFVLCGRTAHGGVVSMSAVADPGEHDFTEFAYDGGHVFGLTVQSWGQRTATGPTTCGTVEVAFATDEVDALARACSDYPGRVTPERATHEWWSGPIFDGWGQQCWTADIFHTRTAPEVDRSRAAYEASTQANYEQWVDDVIRAGIRPRVVTVGARWAATGGLKDLDVGRWPRPDDFVRRMRERCVHPILWWDPFEPSGFDHRDCITWDGGEWADGNQRIDGRTTKFGLRRGAPIAPDYTLLPVRELVRSRIRELFADDGVGFEGVKLDHLAALPALPGLTYPPGSLEVHGLEYLRFVLEFITSELRAVRPDAFVIGEASHPYVSDLLDMITIGDLYTPNRDVRAEAEQRARVISAAAPHALIEMNGWPVADVASFDAYVRLQPELGVPALYYATHLDASGEPLSPSLVTAAEVWAAT